MARVSTTGHPLRSGRLQVVDSVARRLNTRAMDADLPDPNSPFFIVRKADPSDHGSSVQLVASSIDAGPPLRIEWKIPYYGKPDHRPVDIYSGPELRMLCRRGNLPPSPVIASAALHARLVDLAPDAFAAAPVSLVSPDGGTLAYVVITPHTQLEGRSSDEAKPGDLQWSKISFSEREASVELFTLSQKSQTYLIASRRIVDALAGKFREVHASAFHRTSEDGGTRPAMAAFEKKVRDQRR